MSTICLMSRNEPGRHKHSRLRSVKVARQGLLILLHLSTRNTIFQFFCTREKMYLKSYRYLLSVLKLLDDNFFYLFSLKGFQNFLSSIVFADAVVVESLKNSEISPPRCCFSIYFSGNLNLFVALIFCSWGRRKD